MWKKALSVFFVLALSMMLASCACKVEPTTEVFSPVKMSQGEYMKKVDNFIVVLDASQSMIEPMNGYRKIDMATETLKRFNMTIPSDMSLNGALRTFGHGACMSKETTLLLYGLEPYSQAGFAEALDNVSCVGGNSPLADALDAVTEDLNSATGKTAVVIVSDGKDMGQSPLEAARALVEAHSDVCIYTVLVGNNNAGKNLLENLSRVSGCGYMTEDAGIYGSDDMAQFVRNIFYGERYVPKPVPAPVPVVVEPSPKDSDGDGVLDMNDRCPNTPVGACVDQYGCWSVGNVLFDFDKSTIRPDFHSLLNEVIGVFENNPGLKAEIQGHTCNIGTEDYNQKLSERRAKAVYDYMVDHGVDADQLQTIGFGLTRPIASNATKEGRIRNRRVEFRPIK